MPCSVESHQNPKNAVPFSYRPYMAASCVSDAEPDDGLKDTVVPSSSIPDALIDQSPRQEAVTETDEAMSRTVETASPLKGMEIVPVSVSVTTRLPVCPSVDVEVMVKESVPLYVTEFACALTFGIAGARTTNIISASITAANTILAIGRMNWPEKGLFFIPLIVSAYLGSAGHNILYVNVKSID